VDSGQGAAASNGDKMALFDHRMQAIADANTLTDRTGC
jgi:hypothetical protein